MAVEGGPGLEGIRRGGERTDRGRLRGISGGCVGATIVFSHVADEGRGLITMSCLLSQNLVPPLSCHPCASPRGPADGTRVDRESGTGPDETPMAGGRAIDFKVSRQVRLDNRSVAPTHPRTTSPAHSSCSPLSPLPPLTSPLFSLLIRLSPLIPSMTSPSLPSRGVFSAPAMHSRQEPVASSEAGGHCRR